MVLGAVALGKDDLRAINREDLCALTPHAAAITGVAPAYRERMPYHPPATAREEEKAGRKKAFNERYRFHQDYPGKSSPFLPYRL